MYYFFIQTYLQHKNEAFSFLTSPNFTTIANTEIQSYIQNCISLKILRNEYHFNDVVSYPYQALQTNKGISVLQNKTVYLICFHTSAHNKFDILHL